MSLHAKVAIERKQGFKLHYSTLHYSTLHYTIALLKCDNQTTLNEIEQDRFTLTRLFNFHTKRYVYGRLYKTVK